MNGKDIGGNTGSQCYINSTLENVVLEIIEQLAHWKVPFDTYDTRCSLKEYLGNGTIHKVFRHNVPGIDLVRCFIKRNNLTQNIRYCQGSQSCAEVNEVIINEYFNEL